VRATEPQPQSNFVVRSKDVLNARGDVRKMASIVVPMLGRNGLRTRTLTSVPPAPDTGSPYRGADTIQVTASTTMTSRIQRAGATVRRPAECWTPAVHGLLRHLQAAGFSAPRPLGTEGDQEILTWIDGDFGPWNGVWHGERIAGLIDFDHARPAPPVFDIAYALEYAAPCRDDFECLRWLRYPQPPGRRRRIEIFCDGYGIAVPQDIASRVAWQQRLVLQHCQALASHGIEPQATWVREGYVDTVRARINWTESLQIP